MTASRHPHLPDFGDLDFSPLEAPDPAARSTVRYRDPMPVPVSTALTIVAIVSGPVVLLALVGVIVLPTWGQRAFLAVCGGVALLLIVAVISGFGAWDRRHGRRLRAVNALLPAFADANGLSYRAESVVDDTLPAAAGQEGMVQRVGRRLAPLPGSGLPPFEIGYRVFHRPTPAGFVPTERHPYPVSLDYGWYLAVPLPRRLPHIALLRASDRTDSNLDQAAAYPMGVEFDATLTLLVPPGYERDALYLFTPDVLAAMLDDAGSAQWAAEVLDDHLFFRFPHGSVPQAVFAEDLRRAFLLVERTAAELATQAERYRDARTDVPELVAAPGRRMRTRIRPSTVVAAFGLPLMVIVPFAMFLFAALAL